MKALSPSSDSATPPISPTRRQRPEGIETCWMWRDAQAGRRIGAPVSSIAELRTRQGQPGGMQSLSRYKQNHTATSGRYRDGRRVIQEEVGFMEPWALIRRLASALHEFI